jgi:RNA polymerase sigma factor (TIGR02999 family)
MADVTQILSQIDQGDPHAAEQLLPLVYDELRKLAAAKMASEKPGHTLQATALVHEVFVRLVDVETVRGWNGRGHFFAAAAEAMRRILIDNARQKQSLRRGGDHERCELPDIEVPEPLPAVELLALNEAVDRLAAEHPQTANVVKLRFFCGMTIDEVAAALGVSHATVERHWGYARARLHAELSSTD